jgi:hypothetical protein
MTTPTSLEAKKKKLDQRTTAIKKARARLRQIQRQEQARRLQQLGELVEASWGNKLTPDDAQTLGRLLALAVSIPLSMVEVAGALLAVRDAVATPEKEAQTRANLSALVRRHMDTP